jgi:hypothetical protein
LLTPSAPETDAVMGLGSAKPGMSSSVDVAVASGCELSSATALLPVSIVPPTEMVRASALALAA